MIGQILLGAVGAVLLLVAWKVLRGFYVIRRAKALNAHVDALESEIEVLNASTEALNAEAEAEDEAERAEARARTAAEVVALGFVPEAELDTENPGPVPPGRTAALEAARSGDWQAAAAYIEAAGTDWEQRWHRVRALARTAAQDDAWLLAWQAARPGDATAAVVDADTAVLVAWNVRGSQSGSRTTQEQFRLFHDLLLTARERVQEAQRVADPADPVPYMVEQPIAMGLGYPHAQYEQLWERITGRAPKLLCAHTGAVQYWARKWRGSHELALDFAQRAADAAEPGELLTLLPLMAYIEQEFHDEDLAAETFFKEPQIVAAVDAALQDLGAADPRDSRALHLRHALAYLLFWQDRDAQAVEQFRHVDGHIGVMPWSYRESSRYVYARDWAVRVTLLED
ncbi:hypothetical protein [Streptomyces sp. NPDC051567]|uniref:hypothetical protein n=1 Tax=Streptomyces sp. NPDC051567 TaxID=3365660 RepID=UPI0037B0C96D